MVCTCFVFNFFFSFFAITVLIVFYEFFHCAENGLLNVCCLQKQWKRNSNCKQRGGSLFNGYFHHFIVCCRVALTNIGAFMLFHCCYSPDSSCRWKVFTFFLSLPANGKDLTSSCLWCIASITVDGRLIIICIVVNDKK